MWNALFVLAHRRSPLEGASGWRTEPLGRLRVGRCAGRVRYDVLVWLRHDPSPYNSPRCCNVTRLRSQSRIKDGPAVLRGSALARPPCVISMDECSLDYEVSSTASYGSEEGELPDDGPPPEAERRPPTEQPVDVHISPVTQLPEIWACISRFGAEKISIFLDRCYAFVEFTTEADARRFRTDQSLAIKISEAYHRPESNELGHNDLRISPIDPAHLDVLVARFRLAMAYKLTINIREGTGVVSWPPPTSDLRYSQIYGAPATRRRV